MELLIFTLLLSGCATHVYHPNAPKSNFSEAHNDCRVKARVVIGQEIGYSRFSFMTNAWQEFMRECMEGQGWTL